MGDQRQQFPPLRYHQSPHLQNQQHPQQQQLEAFWESQMQEANGATDFKNQSLPLARIKKIMKADEDVRMISAEAPVLFAKACEMFILELTLRSWIHTEENKRRTLQKNDIAAAISRTDVFDFLVDIIPRDELKDEAAAAAAGEAIPYYYMPSAGDQAALYGGVGQQPGQPLPFISWPQTNVQAAPEEQSDS